MNAAAAANCSGKGPIGSGSPPGCASHSAEQVISSRKAIRRINLQLNSFARCQMHQAFALLRRSMGTVGEKLRLAREQSNRSIRELSDETKIRTDHLEALEAGNFETFSAPVYIRGFVRTYAKALKLDAAQTLVELDEELGQTERFKEHPRLTEDSKGVIDFIMLQLSKIN